MTEQLHLDWSTAAVSDGELTVELSGKPPKKWRDVFERTAALLSGGTWEVALKSKGGSVRIAPVRPDDEDRVRQFVEGAVLEANATLVSEPELFESGVAEDDEQAPGADEPEPSGDEKLTERFRAFAQEHRDGDE